MTHIQMGEKTTTRGDFDTEIKRTFDKEVETVEQISVDFSEANNF